MTGETKRAFLLFHANPAARKWSWEMSVQRTHLKVSCPLISFGEKMPYK